MAVVSLTKDESKAGITDGWDGDSRNSCSRAVLAGILFKILGEQKLITGQP